MVVPLGGGLVGATGAGVHFADAAAVIVFVGDVVRACARDFGEFPVGVVVVVDDAGVRECDEVAPSPVVVGVGGGLGATGSRGCRGEDLV